MNVEIEIERERERERARKWDKIVNELQEAFVFAVEVELWAE